MPVLDLIFLRYANAQIADVLDRAELGEAAGYDLQALPLANFFTHLKLPPLPLLEAEVVPMS
jgi:hypothetical protein